MQLLQELRAGLISDPDALPTWVTEMALLYDREIRAVQAERAAQEADSGGSHAAGLAALRAALGG